MGERLLLIEGFAEGFSAVGLVAWGPNGSGLNGRKRLGGQVIVVAFGSGEGVVGDIGVAI